MRHQIVIFSSRNKSQSVPHFNLVIIDNYTRLDILCTSKYYSKMHHHTVILQNMSDYIL
jgi:hypothetical protein